MTYSIANLLNPTQSSPLDWRRLSWPPIRLALPPSSSTCPAWPSIHDPASTMSKANSESHSSTTSRRVHLDFPFKHKHATYLPSPFPAPVKSVPNPSALPAKQQLTPTIHIHSSIPNSLQLPLRCEDTCQDLEYFAKKGESQSSTKDKARFPIYGPTTSIPESERLLLDDPVHEGILNVYSQRRLGENAGLGIAGTLDRDIDISRIPDPAPTKDSKRPQVTWLRRTEYMSDKMKVFGQNRGAENDKRYLKHSCST